MYININNTHYPCTCDARRIWPVRFAGDAPSAVSGVITLCADDGFELASYNTADFLRVVLTGDTLTLTNEPEPVPVDPVPDDTVQVTQEDIVASLLDMDVRLTMIEQGGQ